MQLSSRQLLIFAGAAVGGAALWKYGGNPVAPAVVAAGYVVNVFARGSVLSSSTIVNGVVQPDPETLRQQASSVLGFDADADTVALARMGRSEGVDGMEYRMHVALNDLATLPYGSILELMTHSKIAAADGYFSQQREGKRYSTSRDPYQGDYQLAAQVRQDHANGIDPSGGAVKFVDKSAFATQPGATETYDDIVAEWGAQGLTPVENLPGCSSDFVIFVRSA